MISRVLLVSTHFDDNLEIATMPWAVGNAALAEDKEVAVFLQGLAVREAKKGEKKGLRFPSLPSLDTLKEAFPEAGGQIYVCAPCMNAHVIEADESIEQAEVAGAAFLMQLAERSAIFTYCAQIALGLCGRLLNAGRPVVNGCHAHFHFKARPAPGA